ncbi:MAG TPA: tRNA 2-thiouridine(34) synthase MnmA [Solirubrobacteraceae bacterium]|nr:tRNA 2-thiouridine(34) synthase MnmA [Solirubrobacteraceae bacterium]
MSLRDHLERPRGRGALARGAFSGAAGGAACGDLVRVSVALEGSAVAAAGFDAHGCGSAIAAGSAAVSLVEGRPLLEAARVGTEQIAAELGGLAPAKLHAAELAADALHRALGAAARTLALQDGVPGRTLVAMSGGVDSAVAAVLSGSRAVAVTLELWSDPQNDGSLSCCSPQAVRGARALAHGLGLPHLSLDLRDEFRSGVVEPWLAEHAAGLTPNPCVRCNGAVRLDAMLDLARRLGAEALVTGHYARKQAGLLRVAADPGKDQSYMLAALAPESLARMRFPLGELRKPAVRELARRLGLPVAAKRDSQDLCFLAGTDRAAFLERHGALGERNGEMLDAQGHRIGVHRGVHSYTVGQRRGIGIGGGTPLYVLATDADANTVTVGPRAALATSTVELTRAVIHRPSFDRVRLRYRQRPLACRAVQTPDGLALVLAEPAYGVAPGQLACLMDGEVVVGHATIGPHPGARRARPRERVGAGAA